MKKPNIFVHMELVLWMSNLKKGSFILVNIFRSVQRICSFLTSPLPKEKLKCWLLCLTIPTIASMPPQLGKRTKASNPSPCSIRFVCFGKCWQLWTTLMATDKCRLSVRRRTASMSGTPCVWRRASLVPKSSPSTPPSEIPSRSACGRSPVSLSTTSALTTASSCRTHDAGPSWLTPKVCRGAGGLSSGRGWGVEGYLVQRQLELEGFGLEGGHRGLGSKD